MRKELKKEILALIGQNNGKLSWYRIACAMTDERFLAYSDQIGDILKEIESAKLVAVKDGLFSLTAAGHKLVKNLPKQLQVA